TENPPMIALLSGPSVTVPSVATTLTSSRGVGPADRSLVDELAPFRAWRPEFAPRAVGAVRDRDRLVVRVARVERDQRPPATSVLVRLGIAFLAAHRLTIGPHPLFGTEPLRSQNRGPRRREPFEHGKQRVEGEPALLVVQIVHPERREDVGGGRDRTLV